MSRRVALPAKAPLVSQGEPWRAAPEGIKVSVSPRIFTLAISLAVWYAALRSVAEEFRLRFSPYELMMSPASLLSQRPLDAPVTLCYSISQRSFPPLSADPRIGRARKCGEASFFTPAVSTTALPGRNQRETAHGFSLPVQGWRFLGGGESGIPAS